LFTHSANEFALLVLLDLGAIKDKEVEGLLAQAAEKRIKLHHFHYCGFLWVHVLNAPHFVEDIFFKQDDFCAL